MYKTNLTQNVFWGPVPYRFKTNQYGMRSPEPDLNKKNIFALGASVTDGYYIDNFKNWPSRLHQKLKNNDINYNILNLAKGLCKF